MANVLVCCGGTGAHVALAFMRLHALGHPLGFFRHPNGTPLELPSIYLVDQDNGDAVKGETAWQALRSTIQRHPSRSEWGDTAGRQREPGCHEITPVPVGPDHDWIKQSRDRLASRFEGTDYLACMASPAQQDIRFSHGMMGSPAVGSLLFRLKTYDRGPDGINNDASFETLCRQTGRVAVVGSGVGGTGSSVAPTLAQILANQADTDVMAVMVLNWFKLDDDPRRFDAETVRKAQARNQDMVENASSGLWYYGARLATGMATVPVGVPETAPVKREYAGDTRQPLEEAYPHAVAALSCLRQYLAKDPYPDGLYHMGAADPNSFSGGNHIPGGTLQGMANQGEVLARTARVLATVLTADQGKGPIVPRITELVQARHGDPNPVGRTLGRLATEYRGHLDWLYALGVERNPQEALTREADVRRRLSQSEPAITADLHPEQVAGELLGWIARWVQDEAGGDSNLSPASQGARGNYWPPVIQEGGLSPSAGEAGRLKKLTESNVTAIVEGFVDPQHISHNGWPDAFAAASYFHGAINRMDPTALRKLELLMAGQLDGRLEIRTLKRGDPRPVSLDKVVDDERRRTYDSLAKFGLFSTQNGSGSPQLFGFNSPYTLFCAAPGVSDAMWGRLWSEMTGLHADDWKPDSREAWERCDSWGRSDTVVGKIAAWAKGCRRRNQGDPPVWTRMFRGVSVSPTAPTGFGVGKEVDIEWDGSAIREFLPAAKSGNFRPGDVDLPEGDPASFLEEHGRVLDDAGEMVYERVQFRIPGEDESKQVWGIWKAHLEHLQAEGRIVAFGSERESREVYVVTHPAGGQRQYIVLLDTLILDRESIMVGAITPMVQDFVPSKQGKQGKRGDLYPDLPLRSDYIGLVRSSDKQTVLEQITGGKTVAGLGPSIQTRHGGEVAVWHLSLAGRAGQLPITLRLPDSESRHKAHWMVWPRFRAPASTPWRAYYVYEHCTDPRLHLDTLYFDPDQRAVLKSCNDGRDRLSYPVRYDPDSGVHKGGPPIAFSLRDTRSDQEQGIYFVSLDPLPKLPERVSMGVDFGTSHTVGAVSIGNESARQIELAPELGSGHADALSKHVSQNSEHVRAPAAALGLLSQSVWMPTYVESVQENLRGLLPTELLTIKKCDAMASRSIDDWVPMLDFVVPPVGISREDFVDHVIANFKWHTASAFRGNEMPLRRVYLDRVVELFTAEVLARFGRPVQSIDCTFTYPLRTPADDVVQYQSMVRDVIRRASESFGCGLQLTNGIGIFDESHATKVGTKKFGEVCIVGDLGGGTLDLIISSQRKLDLEFAEAVDSVKIGGNLLLQALARELEPMPEGWATTPEDRATQLVAWMRNLGARRLFAPSEGSPPVIDKLGLHGFESLEKARPGRELIHRYFYLVSEYLARSLAAYLARHWYPKTNPSDWKELQVLVYLRGNGWRLWPERDDYRGIETVVADRVAARVAELWRLFPRDGLPDAPRKCMPGGATGHPKRGPVRRVVGESRPHTSVRDHWLSYTMVDLRILKEVGDRRIPWYESIPFETGGAGGVQVQLEGVHPPIPLNSPKAERHLQLDRLSRSSEWDINDWLERKGDFGGPEQLNFRAPVGALVWEAAFESELLKKGRQG